jgi:hypothetical protein
LTDDKMLSANTSLRPRKRVTCMHQGTVSNPQEPTAWASVQEFEHFATNLFG